MHILNTLICLILCIKYQICTRFIAYFEGLIPKEVLLTFIFHRGSNSNFDSIIDAQQFQLIARALFPMSSSKKYVTLQPYHSELPDYLLTFVNHHLCKIDNIIKFDTFNALRYSFLHYSLQQLVYGEVESRSVVWLFIDPDGQNNLLADGDKVLSREKISSNDQTFETFDRISEQQLYALHLQTNGLLQNKLQFSQLQQFYKLKIISIDQIRLKCEANIYLNAEEIQRDIKRIIAWNQIFRAHSRKSYEYLTILYEKIVALFLKKDFFRRFYEIKNNDLARLIKYDLHFKTEAKVWPYIPQSFREYEYIETYEPSPPQRREEVLHRLISKKQPVDCPDDCVCLRELQPHEYFCKYSLLTGWQTKCPNRAVKLECNHKDEQRMRRCRNSQIKKQQRKKCVSPMMDGVCEIQQKLTWGIDLYTRNIIYHCLPEIDIDEFEKRANEDHKNYFIQKTLTKAMNFMGADGYDIIKICQYIKRNSSHPLNDKLTQQQTDSWTFSSSKKYQQQELFSHLDYEYADLLIRNFQQSPDKNVFRIYTKGKGAICIDKKGIKQGTFIIQYYGELYEPWRWYDREDFIKEIMRKKKMKNVIPEFYNIYMQKHNDQPLGYDILVVDPSRKGNFSSRFSHSCDPNCGTITTVSNGKYYIGMYSFRDIQYGEQLTFDYCSMTQSNYQHLHSICLCGMKRCRGNYLQLSNSKTFNNLMDNKSCFYLRSSVILKSREPVTEKDYQICASHNIKSGFIENTPQWMIKWMSQILVLIEEESQTYKQSLVDQWRQNYPWDTTQCQEQRNHNIQFYSQTYKQQLISIRFQNLITSMDKLKFFFSKIDNQVPPIVIDEVDRILDILVQKQDSVLHELQQCFIKQKCQAEASIIQSFLIKMKQVQNKKYQFFLFRLCMLIISHQLLFLNSDCGFSNELLSDILFFYAFTHTYFGPNQYKSFDSDQIVVAASEITGQAASYNEKKEKTKKKYSSPFVWGQMVSWFKQTIVCPEASLSQDRRGTLSYPLIKSAFKSEYPYDKRSRSYFLKMIREKPASSWPPSQTCDLSFKNPYKLYGSMMFQNIHSKEILAGKLPKETLLESCMSIINQNFNQKLNLFMKVESILAHIPQDLEFYSMVKIAKFDHSENIPLSVRQSPTNGEPRKRVKRQICQDDD